MWELETNARDAPLPLKQTASCTGLQQGAEVRMWLLNGKLHVNTAGEVISPQDSPFIWLNAFVGESLVSDAVATGPKTKPIRRLIKTLEQCYQYNTTATLLTLGSQLLCLHYEALNKTAKLSVPASVLFGDINHGKSKATQAALSLLGIQETNFISQIPDSKARQITAQTTLGVVINVPGDIATKIMHHYDMGKATSQDGTYTPRYTFISSINDECLQKLASLPLRYTGWCDL